VLFCLTLILCVVPNVLQGVNMCEPEVIERFQKAYPYDTNTTQRLLLQGKHAPDEKKK